MTICGYNERIGEGLRLLIEGMIQSLEEKAAQGTPQEAMYNEVRELNGMISTLKNSDETLAAMFVGLNLLARPYFERVRRNLAENPQATIESECHQIGETFISLLAATERRNIAMRVEDQGRTDTEEIARNLASWVLVEARERDGELKPTTSSPVGDGV